MSAATPFLSALLMLAAPGEAADLPYRLPVPQPDAAAQLAEMIGLYDEICLKAFPDDNAVKRAVTARGTAATEMRKSELRRYLHDDPGVGWFLAGRTGRFEITIEGPPFHACGIRTLTVSGFPDLSSYRQLADAFEAGHDAQKIGPENFTVGKVDSIGGGETWKRTDSADEALLVFSSTPSADVRVAGKDGVEMRFVHQIHRGEGH
ncbi:MAG TPA: hypothetical protein VFW19_07945 [Allosphingosinicella sp.]|nr:hypothetical protein [Allosphingosinicella sp.]